MISNLCCNFISWSPILQNVKYKYIKYITLLFLGIMMPNFSRENQTYPPIVRQERTFRLDLLKIYNAPILISVWRPTFKFYFPIDIRQSLNKHMYPQLPKQALCKSLHIRKKFSFTIHWIKKLEVGQIYSWMMHLYWNNL